MSFMNLFLTFSEHSSSSAQETSSVEERDSSRFSAEKISQRSELKCSQNMKNKYMMDTAPTQKPDQTIVGHITIGIYCD